MPSFTLETTHGLISVIDTALKNDKPTLLLLHDVSSSAKQFRHMLDSPTLNTAYRMVTFCLPGHGSSSNAPDIEKTYRPGGYADLAVHVLRHLTITSVVVMGWGLGGHIGIEIIPLLQPLGISLKGLMLIGTPPALGKEQTTRAFKFSDGGLGLAGEKNWSEAQAETFARNSAAAGKEECFEPWILEDAKRADERARMIMRNSLLGTKDQGPQGVDQRRVVEESDVLIAIVNGAEDQFVNLDYLDEINWKRLWRGTCIRLEGLRHCPFREEPMKFDGILFEFLRDCEKE